MTEPLISVAMSVFDNAPYLAHAIESILAQTFGNFEFLIVNDGSRDGSGEIIDRYAAADSRIRPLHQANAGLIVSLNRMIGEARAPLIARMDGDDIALPERFERQIAFLDANPDIGVLGTGCTCIDEDGRPSTHKFDNVTTPEDVLEDLKNGPPLCHPSVVMRRDAVRAVGGYHQAYKHCEDYDLWLRLSEHVRMANLPDRLLLYRQSETQVSNRHAYVQKIGAAIAWEAHVERMAGRPDPTESLDTLPPMDQLDRVFGRAGVFRAVREKVALGSVYTPTALRGEGFDLMLAHIREGGATDGLWRTVVRLLTLNEPARAFRLAAALLKR
ncbi:glycosyltransferase [Sphingomonas sp. SUN039]|uniref:glycosyltransferase n=1 Tax=Sphingomonas sp. SUN039 TaxID=2937787 RepID=UPI002164A570|nr:glycosyltransferase [Sphingomonas sp. SUN039]UVO52799.1 glycosyltransferase [Sphingomonas sp. SUN039]